MAVHGSPRGTVVGSLFFLLFFLSFLSLISVSFSSNGGGNEICHQKYFTYNATFNLLNPLRGFVFNSLSLKNPVGLPYSLEYAEYPLSELMQNLKSYNWTRLISQLTEVEQRGNSLVLKVYLDQPPAMSFRPGYHSGVPDFLTVGHGAVSFTRYYEHGCGTLNCRSPDYNNARLVSALELFIKEFGKKFDGDPRIGFIMIGLLGFNGEWQTWPQPQLMANANTQKRILSAYENSFTVTRLLAPNSQLNYWCPPHQSDCTYTPNQLPFISHRNFGFVDDQFTLATSTSAASSSLSSSPSSSPSSSFSGGGESWFFQNQLVSKNMTTRWQKVPIGGVVPRSQTALFEPSYRGQDFDKCAALTHASFAYFPSPPNPRNPQHALAMINSSLSLGYSFYLKSIHLRPCSPTEREKDKKCVIIDIHLLNKGNSPFYYPLFLAADLLIRNPPQKRKFVGKFNLQNLLPTSTNPKGLLLYKKIYWTGDDHGDLIFYLVTNYANRPISFSSNGVDAEGKISVPLPSNCQPQPPTTPPPTTTPLPTTPLPTTTSPPTTTTPLPTTPKPTNFTSSSIPSLPPPPIPTNFTSTPTPTNKNQTSTPSRLQSLHQNQTTTPNQTTTTPTPPTHPTTTPSPTILGRPKVSTNKKVLLFPDIVDVTFGGLSTQPISVLSRWEEGKGRRRGRGRGSWEGPQKEPQGHSGSQGGPQAAQGGPQTAAQGGPQTAAQGAPQAAQGGPQGKLQAAPQGQAGPQAGPQTIPQSLPLVLSTGTPPPGSPGVVVIPPGQSGGDDSQNGKGMGDSYKHYIQFFPQPRKGFEGIFFFRLPRSVKLSDVVHISLDFNLKFSNSSSVTWCWKIFKGPVEDKEEVCVEPWSDSWKPIRQEVLCTANECREFLGADHQMKLKFYTRGTSAILLLDYIAFTLTVL